MVTFPHKISTLPTATVTFKLTGGTTFRLFYKIPVAINQLASEKITISGDNNSNSCHKSRLCVSRNQHVAFYTFNKKYWSWSCMHTWRIESRHYPSPFMENSDWLRLSVRKYNNHTVIYTSDFVLLWIVVCKNLQKTQVYFVCQREEETAPATTNQFNF